MSGMLSNTDILSAIKSYQMSIAPFDADNPDERLTPAGFNFSFTNFIISLNDKVPYKLYSETVKNEEDEIINNIFFELQPGDSALALTRETIWVSGSIAGTFHSKVAYAAKGLGQISTTLDPGWQGQLLISMNNPNKFPIKIIIASRKGNEKFRYKTFITLCLYRLETTACSQSDNVYARLEIIENVLRSSDAKNSETCRNLLNRISDLKTTVERLRIQHAVKLDLSTSNEKTLKEFSYIHEEVLKKLEKIMPLPQD